MEKVKSNSLIAGAIVALVFVTSCKKEECHECHYDSADGTEVAIGTQCGDELETIEANGYTASDGTTYDVHCHEH